MTESFSSHTFSIVVETDNVKLATLERLRVCLDSLARQQPTLGRAMGVFLVDAGVIEEGLGDALLRAYPWLTVVRGNQDMLYVGLKLHGATLSDSDIIVYCDADVEYESGWLDAMLTAFRTRPDAQIVAGETTTPIRDPYSLAVALTFIFPRFSDESDLAPSPTYWANNVALRRELVEICPIPDPAGVFRGHNILHSLELSGKGLTIWRQPLARAHHNILRPSAIARRYFLLGRDAVALARLTQDRSGHAYLAAMAPDRSGGNQARKFLGRIWQVARANPLHLGLVPFAAPIVGLFAVCYFAGRLLPDFKARGNAQSAP